MKYRLFRAIETFFFVVIFARLLFTAEGLWPSLSMGHLGPSFSFSTGNTETIVIESTLLGFIVGIFATLKLHTGARDKIWVLSLVLSVLGIAGYCNEILRFFFGHRLSFILDLSFIVLLLDWYLLKKSKQTSAGNIVTPEERVAAATAKDNM